MTKYYIVFSDSDGCQSQTIITSSGNELIDLKEAVDALNEQFAVNGIDAHVVKVDKYEQITNPVANFIAEASRLFG